MATDSVSDVWDLEKVAVLRALMISIGKMRI
jgi:hypothetical protein